ncbi:MAG: hypothetical protein IKY28_01980, partial [Anaerotignum sp.]|nr:hypothetical protein [Anaerotignum sp.]
MNPFHDMQTEIYEYFHSSKKTKIAMWIIVALFPLYLTYACNSIAFGTNKGMTALLENNAGAFLLGAVVVYLIFGTFACLTRRIPLAAFLTALIFLIMPIIDYFKMALLEVHFFPWDFVFAKNAGSFGTFLTDLKVPDMAWNGIFMTVFYFLFILLMKPEIPVAWKKRIIGTPVLLACLYLFCMNPTVRNGYEMFGIS